jgi:hypothetical protein
LLKGLSINPKPVTTSKTQTSILQDCPNTATTPVTSNRTPTKNPKNPSVFRTFSAEPLTRNLNNLETATTPPKIKTYGAQSENTESVDKSKPNHNCIWGTTSLKTIPKETTQNWKNYSKQASNFDKLEA